MEIPDRFLPICLKVYVYHKQMLGLGMHFSPLLHKLLRVCAGYILLFLAADIPYPFPFRNIQQLRE